MVNMDSEDKLSMSLDDISESRKAAASSNGGGKVRTTKRFDRISQRQPYTSSPNRYRSNDDQNCKVYVGNLSWNVKWQELKDHMRAAGEVKHADIMETSNGRSKGCGIVTFSTPDEALKAIETLNDTELDGRLIFVREDRLDSSSAPSSTGRKNGAENGENCRVYVGNLSWDVKWQDLKDHMKNVGNVLHADVLEEPSGRSKGCGLVEYSSPAEARDAIDTLNDTELKGRKIFVREDREPDSGSISSIAHGMSNSRGSHGHNSHHGQSQQPYRSTGGGMGTSLYVGNLSWSVTWKSLKDLFRTVGDVERAEVATFPGGKSRGFGIVRFAKASDAQHAIERLNNTELEGRSIEVRFDRRD